MKILAIEFRFGFSKANVDGNLAKRIPIGSRLLLSKVVNFQRRAFDSNCVTENNARLLVRIVEEKQKVQLLKADQQVDSMLFSEFVVVNQRRRSRAS